MFNKQDEVFFKFYIILKCINIYVPDFMVKIIIIFLNICVVLKISEFDNFIMHELHVRDYIIRHMGFCFII